MVLSSRGRVASNDHSGPRGRNIVSVLQLETHDFNCCTRIAQKISLVLNKGHSGQNTYFKVVVSVLLETHIALAVAVKKIDNL